MNNKLVSKVLGFTKEYSPELLISAGVCGMISSTIFAVKATPKAMRLMEDKKSELGVTYLTRREIVETTWKQYLPATGLGVVSAACIVLGTTKNMKRTTALATVYALSENTLKEYQRKTVAIVGEEKAKEIESEVVKTVVREAPVIVTDNDSEYVIHTGDGDQLMLDSFTGRYFRSSMNSIDRAVNEFNKRLMNEHQMNLNEFYSEANIATVDAGKYVGWLAERDMMDVRYDSDIDKNGTPYLILSFYNRPIALRNSY